MVHYKAFGRSDLKVSRACLGTMNLGHGADDPSGEGEAAKIIGAFLDAGHNVIGTTNVYTQGRCGLLAAITRRAA